MTTLDILRSVFGLLLALVAGQMARVTGRFMMAFLGEGSPLECSAAYLNPVSRWIFYYLAPFALVCTTLLLFSSWTAGILVLVWVAWCWFRGTRAQIERGLPHYFCGMQKSEPSISLSSARQRMYRILYRNLKVNALRPMRELILRAYFAVLNRTHS